MRVRKLTPTETIDTLTIPEAVDVYMISTLDLWEKEEGGIKEYALVYEEDHYHSLNFIVIKSWCSASEISLFLTQYVETEFD